ncbi:MAG TPA: ABC transporter permease [Gemmatimonadales bacterium]
MHVWRRLVRGARALVHPADAEQDIADEVRDYLERAAAAHRARGLAPEAALRAAHLELGNVTGVREQVRSIGWEHAVESFRADLRHATRQLAAQPGFTLVTVLTLALGIGGTTAIFSAVNPILFQALPYPDPNRVVMIVEPHGDGGRGAGSFGMYRAFADRSRSFDALAALKSWQPTLTGLDRPERLDGQRVSASYFRVLGVAPAIGRDFQAADDQVHGPNVVIVSDALWRSRLGGNAAILGRPITLDGDPYVVIGVMPPDFDDALGPAAKLWAPLQYDLTLGSAWGHHLHTVGRLRAGMSVEQANREVREIGASVLAEQHPRTYDPHARFLVAPLQAELTRGVRPGLLAIMGGVTLVLVIALVNVTNLLLARGVRRRAEFALRAALGAGRGRLVRQVLTETLVLAAAGGVIGIAIAVGGVRALVALSPPALPRIGAIAVDGTVLAFALGITTVNGVAVGVIPALHAARADLQAHLQHGSRRAAGGHRGARDALVVAEVSLACVLLVTSGLLLRSLERLFAVTTGFDGSRVLSVEVAITGHRYDADSAAHRFFADALDAVRQVPGVTSAAYTSQLPLSSDDDEYGANVDAGPTPSTVNAVVFRYAVSPGYLETMGIPLVSGRRLDAHDGAGAPAVALISASLARSQFAGRDPLGQRLRVGPSGPLTIVGVVGDVRQLSLAVPRTDAVYVPATQWPIADRVVSYVVAGRGAVASLAPAVRAAIWSVDPDQPIVRVATLDGLVAATAAERRFALTLFEAFALAALMLAAAGIHGLLSGRVAERTREIGVRAALGASRRRIVGLVLGQGLTLVAVGILGGLAGSAAATRAIGAMLFGVSRLDPATYLGVIGLLAGVAAIACAVPAWRAARVDPATTLRAE